jgi:predicted secreted protein
MRSIRFLLLCGMVIWTMGLSARAADIAAFQSIGFSSDGTVFAFEEYGIQDGSGFPYANIYVLDTVHDTYVAKPVRILLKEENNLANARKMAMDKARSLIEKYHLDRDPGNLVAFNPVTEESDKPDAIRYFRSPMIPPVGEIYGLKLDRIDLPVTPECKPYDTVNIGFRLSVTSDNGKPVNRVVHEDKSIPESRGCPNGYRLGGVITPMTSGGPHIAMVQVNTFGFEGSDGRWIAVPVTFTPE